jgi:hypothetical protein
VVSFIELDVTFINRIHIVVMFNENGNNLVILGPMLVGLTRYSRVLSELMPMACTMPKI